MADIKKKMTGQATLSIEDLPVKLKSEMNADLVDVSWRSIDKVTVVLMVFERYFWRTSSYASLTIMLMDYEGNQTIDIVASGGGEGFFNLSWGANADFAAAAVESLQKYGFKEE